MLDTRTIDEIYADLRLGLAEAYLRDIVEWASGDTERFGRMVGAGGASMPGSTPANFARMIRNIASEDRVRMRHSGRLDEILAALDAAAL